MDDTLLTRFATTGDSQAFGLLVRRHIQLVYAAARRQVGDEHLAQDVTQAVFMVLARKAKTIHNEGMLPGWLIKTTRLTAISELRKASRRRQYELQAGAKATMASHSPEATRLEIRECVDDAMLSLNDIDRTAVTMVYLQGRSVADVAAALGVSPAAAEKRARRAVQKMRDSLRRRGVIAPVAAITSAMVAESVVHTAAASALAASVTSAALSSAAAAPVGVASIIKGYIMTIGAKKGVSATAYVLFAILAVSAILFFKFNATGGGAGGGAQTGVARAELPSVPATLTPASQAAAPAIVQAKVRVGVLAVHLKDRIDKPGGASRLAIVKHLPADLFELHAIVDATVTDNDPDQVAQRDAMMPEPTIDISDTAALDALDVIIASREWTLSREAAAAIHHAVNGGVGLLNQTPIGMNSPGLSDPNILDLHGMSEEDYFYLPSSRGDISCVMLVEKHELLAGLNGATMISPGLNGVIGTLHGTPIFAAPNQQNRSGSRNSADIAKQTIVPTTSPTAESKPDVVFYTLYTTQLGKGRIVGCQWYTPEPPAELAMMEGEPFYPRCVHWLAAGRSLPSSTTMPAFKN